MGQLECNIRAQNETRANLYRLLSLYYYEPEKELIDKRALSFLAAEMAQVCPEGAKYAAELTEEANIGEIEDLRIDYAKLFVGPFDLLAPPYGSVYLEKRRRVMGESTLDALRCYQEAGLTMDRYFMEAPDHIAAELEFMYYLSFQDLDNESVERQKYFLEHHLGAWVEDFTALVEERAETNFYRHLARITRLFVNADQVYLEKLLIDLPVR